MKILVLGGAGFIGTNLALSLAQIKENELTLVDEKKEYFISDLTNKKNIHIIESKFNENMKMEDILRGQDVVYHLVSTTVPTTSNQHISQELRANVIFSSLLFDACVKSKVSKVVFISSGGTVYGKEGKCPLTEETATNPISSYGIQKVTIEKLLYLYNYLYGIDYRIIRLANPYGPYQRPNGLLGAVTTFTYKALNKQKITVYGDGSVIRDYIYIDDAIRAIQKIVNGKSDYHIFNLGSGYGTSLTTVLNTIEKVLNTELDIEYKAGRMVDVPQNFLDISRYEECYGVLTPISLTEGIELTAKFMKNNKFC